MNILSIDVGIKNLSFCLFNTNNNIKILKWNNINISESNIMQCIENDKNGLQCNKPCKYYIKENEEIKCFCLKHSKKQDYIIPTNELKESTIKKKKLEELILFCNKYEIKYQVTNKKELINLIVSFLNKKCFIEVKKNNASKTDLVTIGRNIQNKFDNELIEFVSSIDKIIIENQIGPIANKMKTIQGMIAQYFIMKNNNISIEFISATNKLKDFTNYDKLTYKERKKLGIEICGNFVNNDIRFQEWQTIYNNSAKKDDLSDCFLQGMWYLTNKI
jgi:hypothetical protein